MSQNTPGRAKTGHSHFGYIPPFPRSPEA